MSPELVSIEVLRLQYFVRSARLVLERVLSALEAESKLGKQADPDKQKG